MPVISSEFSGASKVIRTMTFLILFVLPVGPPCKIICPAVSRVSVKMPDAQVRLRVWYEKCSNEFVYPDFDTLS